MLLTKSVLPNFLKAVIFSSTVVFSINTYADDSQIKDLKETTNQETQNQMSELLKAKDEEIKVIPNNTTITVETPQDITTPSEE